MACDVNLILIAREGRREADHELHTAIFAAQGAKLPPLNPETDPVSIKDRIRARLRASHAVQKGRTKPVTPPTPPADGAKQQAR